jgi:hypothetical protein
MAPKRFFAAVAGTTPGSTAVTGSALPADLEDRLADGLAESRGARMTALAWVEYGIP